MAILDFVSAGGKRVRVLLQEKQATLLASRRERHFEF
jgi:hypothetical protein